MTKIIEIEVPEGYNEKLIKTDNGLTIEFIKVDKEKEMKEFLKPFLTELVLVSDERYPNSVFYKKNGEVIFELQQDPKNFYPAFFWVHYTKIWNVFKSKFGLSYTKIQSFIKTQVENTLKIQGVTPFNTFTTKDVWWKTL